MQMKTSLQGPSSICSDGPNEAREPMQCFFFFSPRITAFTVAEEKKVQEAPENTSWLTNGAVGTHPVGIAAAEAGVGEVGAVPTALVWALDPCQLTV